MCHQLQNGLQHYSVLTHLVGLLPLDPLQQSNATKKDHSPSSWCQGCAGALWPLPDPQSSLASSASASCHRAKGTTPASKLKLPVIAAVRGKSLWILRHLRQVAKCCKPASRCIMMHLGHWPLQDWNFGVKLKEFGRDCGDALWKLTSKVALLLVRESSSFSWAVRSKLRRSAMQHSNSVAECHWVPCDINISRKRFKTFNPKCGVSFTISLIYPFEPKLYQLLFTYIMTASYVFSYRTQLKHQI